MGMHHSNRRTPDRNRGQPHRVITKITSQNNRFTSNPAASDRLTICKLQAPGRHTVVGDSVIPGITCLEAAMMGE
jgi:hypothetical protein